MKTKDVPAIIMLLAGGVYCLFGILYKIPLMDFTIQLLIVLIIFWIFGGIVRMVLDRFIGEIEVKEEEEDSKESEGSEEESDSDAGSKEEALDEKE